MHEVCQLLNYSVYTLYSSFQFVKVYQLSMLMLNAHSSPLLIHQMLKVLYLFIVQLKDMSKDIICNWQIMIKNTFNLN